MELKHLATFRSVADHLSFTQASERLHLAQSSVSAQIKALEEDLGVRLFDRIGRKTVLTEPGQKLYEYARHMEELSREIRSELASDSDRQSRLTVRVPETLAAVYMPSIIERFCHHHPRVRLTFINCTDRQLKEELNSGRIDLAFLMTDTIHLKDVHVRFLKDIGLEMVASPLHPLAQKKEIALRDIHGKTLLLPRTD